MNTTPIIRILAASVRDGRKSDRVALYFQKLLKTRGIEAEILDLKTYNFPIFSERLKFLKEPSASLLEFSEKIKTAEGIIIVTPEYNGGYPASLKNAVDVLYAEWQKKPVVISTVSSGPFAGSQVLTSFLFSIWKIGALVVPVMFPVPEIEKSFNERGEPSDKEGTDKRGNKVLDELLYWVDAKKLKTQ